MTTDTRAPAAPHLHPLLKLVLEMGPLAVFFLANSRPQLFVPALSAIFPAHLFDGKEGGIFTATAVFMIATLTALAVNYALVRRLPIMPLVSGVVVVVFGGLTLFLHDDLFIKLKPTIVNTLFGSILLGGLYFGRSLLTYVLDAVFDLTPEGWRILTLRWGLFFFFLAILNEVVWRNFSTDFWVSFKVFGVMPITFIFAAAQVPLLTRHDAKADGGDPAA
ncbi:MAG: septation protein A [Labrys sp. (in: a-proteobacteria)]